jgi:hypothetical protein
MTSTPADAAAGPAGTDDPPDPDPVALSHEFLRTVKMGGSTHEVASRLRDLDREALAAGLETDGARIAFWVNVYNAAVNGVLAAAPETFEDRSALFDADIVTVAGRDLSPNDVEHALLRGGRPVWGLGFVRNPFPSAFAERFRVRELDPRIHFALNCGAAACPPIAAYSRDGIDDELDMATRSYLDGEADYDPDAGVVRAPRLLLWFMGDFGGPGGAKAFLREYDVFPATADPSLRFKQYDWSLDAGNFAEE